MMIPSTAERADLFLSRFFDLLVSSAFTALLWILCCSSIMPIEFVLMFCSILIIQECVVECVSEVDKELRR
jgi:hypothetical protein